MENSDEVHEACCLIVRRSSARRVAERNRRVARSTVAKSDDALNMFYGSDLRNLAVGDFLVRK